jgi:hypothetical protein
MNAIRNSSKLILFAMILLLSAASCKSKKKAMEAANAEKARMEQEAALQKQREEDERKKREAEAEAARKQSESSASAKSTVLAKYFDAISTASNPTAANNSISEALTMFSSPEVPVLIIISGTGDQKDYDRPTTIQNYLNYLKDQKKRADTVEDIKYDASGKISELELRKK